jgi:sugar lactone lactonase YvrE
MMSAIIFRTLIVASPLLVADQQRNFFAGQATSKGKEIKTPERPTSIVISNDDKMLYITSAGSLFGVALQ